MWIAYAILAAAALVVSAALALHKWECRRCVRGTIARSRNRTSALPTLLIVPCKGAEVRQEENLRAFFEQQGVSFLLRFVVEDAGDSAARLIVRLQQEYASVRSELVIAGRSVQCGQKVHNLLAATEELPDGIVALAFADADNCPHPHWLAALLTRLDDPQIGARTGYRWFIPQRLTWPNLLLYSLNSSVGSLFCRRGLNTVWGGAWAIRRDVFERTGIREAWFGTLNDDLVATRVLHGTPLRIEFEPLCMTASPIDMSPAEMWNFLRRQFIQVRRYVPAYWWMALAASSLFQAVLWTSAGLALARFAQGQPAWLPAAVFCALYGLAVFRGWLGQSAFREQFADHESLLAWHRRFDILLGPLLGICSWVAIVSSGFGSSMTWRGIRYWISPGGRILQLGRTLAADDLRALRERVISIPSRDEQPALRLHRPDDPSEVAASERRKAA
jgi:hypothetical protein